MSKRGLGRGLEALIPMDSMEQKDGENVQEIDIKAIVANDKQPRKDFDEQKLDELAASMKQHGVLQPVIVRKKGNIYELVAGERRWRAAAKAGIKKIPAIVKELSDADVMEIALIENLQREDLNPMEEALAYKTLMDDFGLTQEELSKRVGKSRSQIANTVRLLNLESEIQELVLQDKLTAGHARALLSIQDKKCRYDLAKKISSDALSVRQTEQMAKKISDENKHKNNTRQKEINPVILDITEKLQRSLGTRVRIKGNERRGKIEIEFYSGDELERILEVITE
ncbi:chromosome partitioning protein [Tepidanaerobacter acetatoxydans Re1]|uniref:Chromosome partitioning protein n=1 Tax=Tepidanaerobacter acetatoxydans (strain DSM 21804 / JCM 16047 / Re1) TaxID=1209989 RepID=F4LV82_TEPAE|nr:ParB/RepB/Spo0J family partition protein [Tepidanaerobacter acetatoxydans]AEE92729.1 parB-like partition protein [Tepidanaerobacter acetatoxydans Re1]CCP27713.1 chromosome partitioning protein [Tepidanaerobacter acetatoxydans Re1]